MTWPTVAQPQCRTGLTSVAHMAWLVIGCGPHLRAARTRPRARSESVPWHGSWWFTGGYLMAKLHTADDLSDGALPGTVWPEAEAMDRPRRGPHGTQRATLSRSVALLANVEDWMTCGKMSTGGIHGPRRTCLTWSQALNQSEEGKQRSARAQRR
jgi:hypothetical protein